MIDKKESVLIVGQDPEVADLLEKELKTAERTDLWVSLYRGKNDGVLDCIYQFDPKVVMIEPYPDRRHLLRVIRDQTEVPIIIATRIGDREALVRMLDQGADDFIITTEEENYPAILRAKVDALMRRSPQPRTLEREVTLQGGQIKINFDQGTILKDEHPIHLARQEWFLLKSLVDRNGEVVPTDKLGISYSRRSHRVQMHRLRRKLEDDPKHPRVIRTIFGAGNRLDVDKAR